MIFHLIAIVVINVKNVVVIVSLKNNHHADDIHDQLDVQYSSFICFGYDLLTDSRYFARGKLRICEALRAVTRHIVFSESAYIDVFVAMLYACLLIGTLLPRVPNADLSITPYFYLIFERYYLSDRLAFLSAGKYRDL